MNYEFTKLSEVEALNEVPENATVLAEVDGAIKRIPGSGLGGAGIKTAIIKSSDYDEAIVSMMNPASPTTLASAAIEYSCINMTFEEAYEIMAAGEPLNALLMINDGGPVNFHAHVAFIGVQMSGAPMLGIINAMTNGALSTLLWSSYGIVDPNSGGGVS